MKTPHSHSLLIALAFCGLMAALPESLQAAPPLYSVEKFHRSKENWRFYLGADVRIEGRYVSIIRNTLRMQNSDLTFRVPDTAPRLVGESRTIELTGQLERDGGQFVFLVKNIRELPSDLETFRKKQSEIRDDDPEQWYAVAEWATKRSQFYNDDELARHARSAYLSGLQSERRALPEHPPESLFQLARKVEEFPLPESVLHEFLHEAYWALWNQVRKQQPQPEELEKLAERIAKELPGSTTPLEKLDRELRKNYLNNPLTLYRSTAEEERQTLHRILYSEIVLTAIRSQADDDGRNGYQIAKQIDERLPEHRVLAETFRERELDFKLDHITTSTRQQAVDLARTFENRGHPERARETLENWLEARTELLRQDGPAGLMQASEDYANLLDDEQTAARLLVEAHSLNPELQEIAQRLNRLGYQFRDGRWLDRQQREALPVDPVQQAMREGRITPGMTAAQVRTTLGVPSSVVRMASARHITEIWVYGEQGTSRLTVHLSRRSRQPESESEVVEISQLKPR